MNGLREESFSLIIFSMKFLTLKEFSDKFGCQINFLHYQKVISAITTRLLTNAKDNATPIFFTGDKEMSQFKDNVEIHLGKARSRDFYNLLKNKTHMGNHSGPTQWSESLSLNERAWSNIFKSLKMFAKKINSEGSLQVHT